MAFTKNDSSWLPHSRVTIQVEYEPGVKSHYKDPALPTEEVTLHVKYRDETSALGGHPTIRNLLGLNVKSKRLHRFPVIEEEGQEWLQGLSSEGLTVVTELFDRMSKLARHIMETRIVSGYVAGGRELGPEEEDDGT